MFENHGKLWDKLWKIPRLYVFLIQKCYLTLDRLVIVDKNRQFSTNSKEQCLVSFKSACGKIRKAVF